MRAPRYSKGAIVTNVEPGGPAASANIQRGDVIIAVDDVPLQPDKEAMSVASAVKSRGIGAMSKLTLSARRSADRNLGQARAGRSRYPFKRPRGGSESAQTNCAGHLAEKEEAKICGMAIRQAAASDNMEFFTKLNELLGSCTANILAPETRKLVYKIKPAIDLTDADYASIYRLVTKCRKSERYQFNARMYNFYSDAVAITYVTDRNKAEKQFVEARLMFEESKINDRKRAKQEAFEATPFYVLGTAYISYIMLKRCEQAREGYQAVYISDAEMEQTRTAVKSLEEKLTRGGELISPDQNGKTWTTKSLWDDANRIVAEPPSFLGITERPANKDTAGLWMPIGSRCPRIVVSEKTSEAYMAGLLVETSHTDPLRGNEPI